MNHFHDMTNKKVLIVCDMFPPAFGPRMGYLCKYMRQAGWNPVVVTEWIDDQTFAFLTDGIETHYVHYFPNAHRGKLIRRLEWLAVFTAAAGITLSVNGFDDAHELSSRLGGASVKVHLKVDTGMGRLGFSFNEFSADISDALRTVRSVASLPGVELEGLYTHFASADAAEEETAFCLTQFDSFSRLIRILEKENLRPPICHCANSAATLRFPQMHLDMCRVGIVQYGLRPSEFVDVAALGFRPVMTLRSQIIYLKEVPTGFPISYGSIWKSHHPSRIATVAVGYGDGYHRCLSNRGEMLLRGKRVPVVGRVCMDLTMIDVSAVPEASVGDEVTVWGTEGNKTLSADEVAAAAGTIGYEMTTGLNVRVPRIFKE